MMKRFPVVGAALLLASFATPPTLRAQAPQYVVTDLGTPSGLNSYGYAINNSGQVAGFSSNTANTIARPMLFSSGNSPLDLAPSLAGGVALGINNAGMVAGFSNPTSSSFTHATLFSAGSTPLDLGTLGGGYSYGYGINNSGQVAGFGYLPAGNPNQHAGLFAAGVSAQDLGTVGGSQSYGFGINDAGQVAGYSQTAGNGATHATLFSPGGTPLDLGTLGGNNSYASSINGAGQLAGYSFTGSGVRYATLYSAGSAPLALGSLGGSYIAAYGINNSGQVTGDGYNAGGTIAHAFLYTGGTMYDLNNLVPAAQGFTNIAENPQGYSTNHINDRGQIAASAIVGGASHALLLTPRNMGTGFSGGLGDLAWGGYASEATAVSNGGSVVAGKGQDGSNSAAFRWTLNGGMENLGQNRAATISVTYGLSADGGVLVGADCATNGNPGAFRYTPSGGFQQLGFLAGDTASFAYGTSGDGAVVVGASRPGLAGDNRAFRWTPVGGMLSLGSLPGGGEVSVARGVSGNGAVVVGDSASANAVGSAEAFRWTQVGGMAGLGDFAGGVFSSSARAASGDGSVIAGYGTDATGQAAFRWSQSGGLQNLGRLAGTINSAAHGISSDGKIIVGESNGANTATAFVWDAKGGMRNLQSVLANDYGVSFTGWTLNAANAVSAAGDAVAGYGTDAFGNQQAFSAQINSRTFRFARGEAYGTPANPFHTSRLGGLGTTVDLLGGIAGGAAGTFKTVSINMLALPTVSISAGFASDVIDLSGSGSDTVVLRLSYEESVAAAAYGSEAKVRLGWFDPVTNQWLNAVAGNVGGVPTFVGDRPYNQATDFALGRYGIDTAGNQVWAVINHNSQFAALPEPGSAMLAGVGIVVLGLRRRHS